MPPDSRFKAIGLLMVLSLIWGTSFILIKQGVSVFAPDEVGALRVASAFTFLLPVAVFRIRRLTRKDLGNLFVSGMLGIFMPAFLFATAQTRLDSSVAGILNTLSPLWTMIIGAAFFGQRFRNTAIVGIIIGFAGTVVLMLARSGGTISGINYYALLIVAACAMYGSNLNWVKFRIPGLDAMTIASGALLFIGPLSFIYLFGFTDFTSKLGTLEGSWKAFGYVVLLGCMSTAIANWLFTILIKISTPLFASSVTYIMPIVAVMWGLLDGESLYVGHYIGMAAIIGGVYLANMKPKTI